MYDDMNNNGGPNGFDTANNNNDTAEEPFGTTRDFEQNDEVNSPQSTDVNAAESYDAADTNAAADQAQPEGSQAENNAQSGSTGAGETPNGMQDDYYRTVHNCTNGERRINYNEPAYTHTPYVDETYTAGNQNGSWSSAPQKKAKAGGGKHHKWMKVVAVCMVCVIVSAAAGIGAAQIWINSNSTATKQQVQIGKDSVKTGSSNDESANSAKTNDGKSSGSSDNSDQTNSSSDNSGTQDSKTSATVGTDNGTSSGAVAVSHSKSGTTTKTASEIYKENSSQVVGIQTSLQATNAFGQTTSGTVSGTGFILTSDGYIATNYHVIEDALQSNSTVKVMLQNGKSYEAKIVGGDSDGDVALLKINATGLSAATLGNSNEIEVGETIYCIGNPLGELTYSLTSGVVSALDRVLQTSVSESINMFQTDVAINSGNSGGPIYNDRGQVIGIATAKNMSTGVEGLGFAIPINDAVSILNELKTNGYVTGKPSIGISTETISSDFAQYYNLKQGAYITYVASSSAAEKAGLKKGDIITKIGDKEITSSSDVYAAKSNYKAGDTATFTVYRDGKSVTVKVTFDEDKSGETTSTQQSGSSSQSGDNSQSGGSSQGGDNSQGGFSQGSDGFGDAFGQSGATVG